jgi:hypothetical protein
MPAKTKELTANDDAGLVPVQFRLPADLLKGLNQWVARLNKTAARPWNRTDLVRVILTKAIKEHAAKGEEP